MNQAKIVKLSRPADTIVVGNPAIADASVQDGTTIVLTGKGFGVTNLVVLDEDGNPIVDEQVTVGAQTAAPCEYTAAPISRPCRARHIAKARTRPKPNGPRKRR